MDRRGFFRDAFKKTSHKVVEIADERARKRAGRWIRPPYAISELEFLLTCSRCGDCIEACPHEVLFALKPGLGAEIVATPAMDLAHKACRLCDGWPCVSKCETGALLIETDGESGDASLPLLSRVSIDTERCLPYQGPECGACEGSCPVEGALCWDMCKPVIDESLCIGCAQCRHACIMQPSAINLASLA